MIFFRFFSIVYTHKREEKEGKEFVVFPLCLRVYNQQANVLLKAHGVLTI